MTEPATEPRLVLPEQLTAGMRLLDVQRMGVVTVAAVRTVVEGEQRLVEVTVTDGDPALRMPAGSPVTVLPDPPADE